MPELGTLRAEMTLQLHTKQAVRLWYGRKSDTHHGILGLSRFLLITDQVNVGSRHDDPYSDWFMLKIEAKIEETKQLLEALNQEVDQFYIKVPATFHFTENFSSNPISIPIYAKSQLSYLAIYILAQYDEIVRKIMQALHLALTSRSIALNLLDQGEHHLRSLFTLSQLYRYTGITRQDLQQGTAAAQAAIDKYGEVPVEVLNGTTRSRFSIPLLADNEQQTEELALKEDEQ